MVLLSWPRCSLGFEKRAEAQSSTRGLARIDPEISCPWRRWVTRAHPPPILPLCWARSRR
jgi:hypothetical protein